jgi:spermidine synthase
VSLRQFASSYPGIAIDLVEHEPAVIELARAWFDLAAIPNASVHLADGAAFIRDAPACSWDIIVIDAYDAVSAGPDFSQPDFLAASRRALQPGGALACNVIGTLSGPGPVANFVSSARSVFDSVRMVPVVDVDEDYAGDTLRNVVVVATCGDAR